MVPALVQFLLLFAPVYLTGTTGCDPGYGRPQVNTLSENLGSGSTIRINSGSSSYIGPTFDSTGTVSGRIEVLRPGTTIWTPVGEWYETWTAAEAQVACRMLGYELGYDMVASAPLSAYGTPDGYLDYYYDDYVCSGTESTLSDCAGPTTDGSGYSALSYGFVHIGVTCTFASYGAGCDICTAGKAQQVS